MLNDKPWLRIADLSPGKAADQGTRTADNRRFVEAEIFMARTRCSWRDFPVDFGNRRSTCVRFARWEKGGIWARVAQALSGEADLEESFIDATIVCALQPAARTPKNGRDQAIGRSRGDVTQGAALVAGIPSTAVSADKGYDSDSLVKTIEAAEAIATIPSRSDRINKRSADWHRYKARHLVERLFNRLK